MLQVAELEVSYGEIPAVRGLDLEVAEGEAVAILGRNGAGKSTTMRAIAGAVIPTAGSVHFSDEDVTHVGAERRVARGICLVPEGRHLFPELTVQENLAMGAYHRKLSSSRLAEEIERTTVHLPIVRERLGQRAGRLSGGEQQLVAIARALLSAPRLLLVDEPSLGLAPIIVDRVYEMFRSLRSEGLTLLIVEQYVEVALSLVDRAAVVDKGQVVLSGTAEELAGSQHLIDAYLSTPSEVSP